MKINRNHLIGNISKTAKISKNDAKHALKIILQCIKDSLADGDKVSISHFGVFDLKTTKPRKYKNIKTGETCQTKPKRIVLFRPSSSICNLLNERQSNKKHDYDYVEDETGCKVLTSKPNPKQTDNLKIQYTPIDVLVNNKDYPIILMPQRDSFLKLPRKGRSDVRGYKEADFWNFLQKSDLPLESSNNEHLSILRRFLPYEPDFVLYDNNLGLYIDVEIDEPYDGFSRIPTHTTDGSDKIRDRYFIESGWVVVRFTEHQIHTNPNGCINLLRSIVLTLTKGINGTLLSYIPHEKKWSSTQAILWEKNLYREKYLGIQSFSKKPRNLKVICHDKTETIETQISRTLIHSTSQNDTISNNNKILQNNLLPVLFNKTILFDEKDHCYYPISDLTGSSDYISVTTLIEQFFPYFDVEAYIQRKILETGKSEKEIRDELKEPSERGTQMHTDIQNFLNEGEFTVQEYKELKLFKKFYDECIMQRKLKFSNAEMKIELPQHNIAGTVDALFQKENGEFVMVDWKRSTHLIIDGYPKKYGFGRGLSVLSHLDNSSYYKYEMQQSFYKYILEEEYGMRISSMILVVLHPQYDTYYPIKLSTYRKKEVKSLIEIHDRMLK